MNDLMIDVSEFQGVIDWKKVKASSINYAMIRVGGRGWTSGKIYVDSKAEENIVNAYKNGIKIGLYFYSQAITENEARAEADFIITVANKHKEKITLPLCIDSEINSKEERLAKINKTTRTNCTLTFLKHVAMAGYTPLLYSNKSHLTYYIDGSKFNNFDLWVAEWGVKKPTVNRPYSIWQYSSTGRVNGINGDVDVNIIYKNYEAKEIVYTNEEKIKAVDVFLGKYGNGAERKNKLGADYEKVQSLVNKLISIMRGV